jgi:nucleotidyltransferase/DNA polymerase involved in DNA repair
MSKNSAYFKRAKDLDVKSQAKVEVMKKTLSTLSSEETSALKSACEMKSLELECRRDLSRICCVLDMDMFYAAVEIRDAPHLKDKPVAVGGLGMISTTNYVARQFGVRSAMPGFIGLKLCPELQFVPCNFEKYTAVGNQIRNIIGEYDPNYTAHSLDEVYFDLTQVSKERYQSLYCNEQLQGEEDLDLNENETNPSSKLSSSSSTPISALRRVASVILHEIRQRITKETGGLTCSAGLANNFMLAKICADKNKPDGQYELAPERTSILEFLAELPTRKVGGIGKVTENMLSELGMHTMLDVRLGAYKIQRVFKPASAEFLSRASLGIAESEGLKDKEMEPEIRFAVDSVGRKSLGAERTFTAIEKTADLFQKLHEICSIVARDLERHQLEAQCVTLKLKLTTFELLTRSSTSSRFIRTCEDIETVAGKLLKAAMPVKIRLMGVSMSKLRKTNEEGGMDKYLRKGSVSAASGNSHVNISKTSENSESISCAYNGDRQHADAAHAADTADTADAADAAAAAAAAEYVDTHAAKMRRLEPRADGSEARYVDVDDEEGFADNQGISEMSCGYADYDSSVHASYGFTEHSAIRATSSSCIDDHVQDSQGRHVSSVVAEKGSMQPPQGKHDSDIRKGNYLNERAKYTCPMCGKGIWGTIVAVNAHIDKCLIDEQRSGSSGSSGSAVADQRGYYPMFRTRS